MYFVTESLFLCLLTVRYIWASFTKFFLKFVLKKVHKTTLRQFHVGSYKRGERHRCKVFQTLFDREHVLFLLFLREPKA